MSTYFVRMAAVLWICAAAITAEPRYDLLLKNGHVIDPRHGVNAVRDVAIKDGKIAAVAASSDASLARKAVDVSSLYITPGFIDVHEHLF